MTQKDLFGEPYEDKKTQKEHNAELDAAFEEWWKHYPPGRKQDKGHARKTFHKKYTDKRFTLADVRDVLIPALKWQTTELWIGRNARYTPMPRTYINGERWTDERPKRVGEAFGKANDENDMF